MILSLAIIFILGILAGRLSKLIKLPPLIGMILVGIVIGPNAFNIIDKSLVNISTELRTIALVVILIRAGLNLKLDDLKKVGRQAILMCFLPAVFEISAMVVFAPMFFNISTVDALLLGSVIAAVSPAVIVPHMLKIMDEKYGIKEGVPQMVLAGSSADDVFVIALFTSFLGLTLKGDINLLSIANVPVSILLGIILGALVGLVISKLFDTIKVDLIYKVLIILSVSFCLVELEHIVKNYVAISGLLSVMTFGMSFAKNAKVDVKEISTKFSEIWGAAQIFLFVLLGMSVNIAYVEKTGLNAVVLILLVLIFRLLAVYIILLGSKFTKKERLFSMIAYIPKATVQAAIGGIPLSMGLASGQIILSISVISILVTAPIGSILVDRTYKKLLKKSE